MQRRRFLSLSLSSALLPALLQAAELPSDIRITRAVAFSVENRRNRVVGCNSHLGVHGDRTTDRMLRLYTNAGIEGLGSLGSLRKEDAAKLLGRGPFDFFQSSSMRMAGLGNAAGALWDLLGKAKGEPVWKLLGAKGSMRVAVYDGSIYFQDLMPEHQGRWRDRFKEELDMGLKLGHRVFKIKIGRGYKWMDRAAGDKRDVEVVNLIRDHLGSDCRIAVDANNGYDLEGSKRFFEQVGPDRIVWAEEMFTENVEQCLAFKEFFKSRKWNIALADGETQGRIDEYKPYIENKAWDVVQGDMTRFGIDGILDEAAMAASQGIAVAPHGWGSFTGFFVASQMGRALANFSINEQDPLSNRVLIPDAGYVIKDGATSVPDAPGLGLAINEKAFATDAKVIFDLKA